MRLSRAKINQLSMIVTDSLDADERVYLRGEQNEIRLRVVKIITEEVERDAAVSQFVRDKISSQKRDFPEGGREWEILYRQYYQEEMDKHRPPRE